MLADPRAETLVTDFALRWLNVDEIDKFEWDRILFPEFSAELREDFATEIDLFLRSVLLEDRNVQELLTADHTFLNERLARHYGIDIGERRAVPARDPQGRGPPRAPRQGRRAVAHVIWQPDFAGGARRLGARQAPRHAAVAAAAECRNGSEHAAGRGAQDHSCDARGASRQSDL